MVKRSNLSPVFYYLQDFNQYKTLGLPASEMGNITLVGKNTAGKTTLANCFYPMLIDGSIATPSFNAAKGTEKLDQSSTARNSQRDTRTFESMLLGWGPGAKKVRTGYSCMLLESDSRRVILGIGAHRAVDGSHSKTWWFTVVEKLEDPIALVTTDENGRSLEKVDFVERNADLGDKLHVFATSSEYRAHVSEILYGFDNDKKLGTLTNTLRLLSSPILSAGGAKFGPILSALKEAQEPIDNTGVLYPVAEAQRKLNKQQALLKQVQNAHRTLIRLKEAVFFSNLNDLKIRYLDGYAKLDNDIQQLKSKLGQMTQRIADLNRQLEVLLTNIAGAQTETESLRNQQAEQKVIVEQKKSLQAQRKLMMAQLKSFQEQIADYHRVNKNRQAIIQRRDDTLSEIKQFKTTLLMPLQAKLSSESATFTQLGEALAEVDQGTQIKALNRYLNMMNQQILIYQSRQKTMKQLNQSVQIVTGMQSEMGMAIDERLSGRLFSRGRDELHQDNDRIHQAGASEMNQDYQKLLADETQQATDYHDLKVILKDQVHFENLQDTIQKYQDADQKLSALQAKVDEYQKQSDAAEKRMQDIEKSLPDEFDEARVTAELNEISDQLRQLVIDPQIKEKLEMAQQKETKLRDEQLTMERKQSELEANKTTTSQKIADDQNDLHFKAEQIERSLEILRPYSANDIALKTVNDALLFEKENRSKIRNMPIKNLVNIIQNRINGANGQQVRNESEALDTLFDSQEYFDIAEAMKQQPAIEKEGLTILSFDISKALDLMVDDEVRLAEAVENAEEGNNMALQTYMTAAVDSITDQYHNVQAYNDMLSANQKQGGIQIKIELHPQFGMKPAIAEALDSSLDERLELARVISTKIAKFTNNDELADDEEAFFNAAEAELDIRDWSAFKVMIHRRQSAEGEYEEVDDRFVQTGGSGAEKAQAMLLPLLLVPKILLNQANKEDAPHLAMFDEFADKLDADTAKVFAKTITRFGFSFIATMPSGGQTKVLADGVENIAWEVIAPKVTNDGKFHVNRVRQALVWR